MLPEQSDTENQIDEKNSKRARTETNAEEEDKDDYRTASRKKLQSQNTSQGQEEFYFKKGKKRAEGQREDDLKKPQEEEKMKEMEIVTTKEHLPAQGARTKYYREKKEEANIKIITRSLEPLTQSKRTPKKQQQTNQANIEKAVSKFLSPKSKSISQAWNLFNKYHSSWNKKQLTSFRSELETVFKQKMMALFPEDPELTEEEISNIFLICLFESLVETHTSIFPDLTEPNEAGSNQEQCQEDATSCYKHVRDFFVKIS